MTYHGINGFLGSRASIMVDIVALALLVILPVLSWSIWQVRTRKRYGLHKRVQVSLAIVLALAVALFEIDMRFVSGWRDRAEASPYFPGRVDAALAVHLVFAITTTLVWAVVVIRALRNFSTPPRPGAHSPSHRFWGWVAAIDMFFTAITGWIFYYLAFVA
jgi:hypothetical protein